MQKPQADNTVAEALLLACREHKTEDQAVMASTGCAEAVRPWCTAICKLHRMLITFKPYSVNRFTHLGWCLLYAEHLASCVEERIQHPMTPQISAYYAWMQCKGFNVGPLCPASARAARQGCALLVLHIACYPLIQVPNNSVVSLVESSSFRYACPCMHQLLTEKKL